MTLQTNTLGRHQSALIKVMRFPLIMLVLFEHSVGRDLSPMRPSLDGTSIYHFVTELVSHHLCSIALCWFFVFSGYLFFRNLEEGGFNWQWLSDKWKSRTRTVFIPHILWNLIYVLAILLVTALLHIAGIGINADLIPEVRKGPIYWFFTGPIDFPLWYLRDLSCMILLTPVFYYLTKKAPWFTLVLLLGLYLASFRVKFFLFPTFSYFGIGAWLGIRKRNMLAICQKVKFSAAILGLALAILATCMYGNDYHRLVRMVFLPFGMITFMNLCNNILRHPKLRNLTSHLSGSVFFIYAAHEIYILGWTKGLFVRMFGSYLASRWINYIGVPVVTLAVCLALYYTLHKIMPRALAFACGGRIHSAIKH